MKNRWAVGIGGFFAFAVAPAWLACNPSAPPPPPIALYAEASMVIGANSQITAGVLVRQIEPLPTNTTEAPEDDEAPEVAAPPTTAQLIVHKGAHVGTDSSCNATAVITANSISAKATACLGNTLTAQIKGNASVASVAAFPLTPITPLPLAPLPDTGATPIDVAENTQTTIAAGPYGAVTIKKGATLILGAGVYSFASLDVRESAQLTTNGAGVSVTTGSVTTHQNATIAPAAGFTAADLQIAVSQDASIGASSTVIGLVAAPHGTLTFADDVTATGAFAAFSVVLKKRVTVNYQSGFAASPHGSQQLSGYTEIDADGSFGAISPLERDKVFSISLGLPYPNKSALDAFIADVSNPKSANYRKYLTPPAFKQTFSPSDTDYDEVIRWVIGHGLTVKYTYTNNLVVTASGTAPQFEKALNVNLFYRVGGDYAPGFIAVDREPSLDLIPPLLWITGFTDSVPVTTQDCNPMYPKLVHPDNLTTIDAVFGFGGNVGRDFGSSDLRQAYLDDHQASDTVNCLSLDGSGQTVGVLALRKTTVSDRDTYFQKQPWVSASPTVPPITVGDLGDIPDDVPDHEATLDIDMVSGMAPQATVQVFQGSTGISGHVTDLVNTMATFTPVLSSITSSYGYGYDDNTNQTLSEFAAQGTSFFDASGDYGDVGDPENNTDFDYQTLVGGTVMNVGTATVSNNVATFTGPPYRINEFTWNGGCPGVVTLADGKTDVYASVKSITGGGIMNGMNPIPHQCYASTCKGSVPTPQYQQLYFLAHPPSPIVYGSGTQLAAPTSGSGASTVFRNYPDVSAVAQDLTIWTNDSPGDSVGTSASAPLWAGYAALVNQALSNANAGGTLGFANPVLYAIGTGGVEDRSGHDVSVGAFHDIADLQFNQLPQPNQLGVGNTDLGFPAVSGYDLATGLGTPTCHLLNLLASPAPLSPPTVVPTFAMLYGEIAVGDDDLKAQSQAFLFLETSSKTYGAPLKLDTDGSWDRGTTHAFQIPLNPPIFATDVKDFIVQLDQNGQTGVDRDNWDVNGIHLRLGNVLNPVFACLVNESGDDSCDPDQPSCHANTGFLGDTTDHGVFRLSAVSGSGGQGPFAVITVPQETSRFSTTMNGPIGLAPEGCSSFSWDTPITPIHSVHVVIDTGNDGMNAASTGTIFIIDEKSKNLGTLNIPLGGLPISDRSEIGYTVPLQADQDPSKIAGVKLTFTPSGNDEWHVFGISAFANADQNSGQDLCLVRIPQAANNTQSDDTFVFNSSTTFHTFARSEGSCGGI